MPPSDDGRAHSIEADVLDQDMTPADLVFVLRYLEFDKNDMTTVRLDVEVRNYLIRLLRRRGHGRPA